MKTMIKRSKADATGGVPLGGARKTRRSSKPADGATSQAPASDSEFAQPHTESREGYELNDTRARWDSGKQVGHKI